jgi:hypothetical protein
MKKIDLGQTITILANLGVIAGIVFLGIEMQQNTDAIQSSTAQSVTSISSSGLTELAANQNMAEIRLKGDLDNASLNEVEALQYFALNRNFWLTFQNVFFQYELGAIRPEVWENYLRIICDDFTYRPGFRSTWDDHSKVLNSNFVSIVENCYSF